MLSTSNIIQKYFDIGDFIGVNGQAFKNKKLEPTVLASHIQLLTKAISPLPDKRHGMTDIESRYRKRYLDMLDPNIQSRIERRSKYFSSMRRFFEDNGFMELDTPRLENTT
jgi:lysyl-tRNA synthetase class 2